MQQQQYERYASGPSFQPVATPDLTPAMDREGQYLQRDMQVAQEGIQANNKMLELSEKNRAAGIEKLANFSETLTNQLVENQKEQNKKQELQGLRDAYVNGVPPEVQDAFNQQLAELNESGASTERALNDAVEGNAITWALSRELSKMSPHMRVGYAKGILQQLRQSYPQQLQTELLDALKVNPGMSVEEKAQRLQDYRYNWMQTSGLGSINPALLNEELFPSMKEAEARVVNKWRVEAETEQREILGEDAKMLMRQPVSQANWDTASELFRAAGFSRSEARSAALSQVTDLATLNKWAGLMSFDGTTTLGEKFNKDFTAQRVAIQQEAKAVIEYNDTEKELAARQYSDPLIERFQRKKPTELELAQAKRRSIDLFGTYDSRLDQFNEITLDDDNAKFWTEELNRHKAAGTLYPGMLTDPRIPYEVAAEFREDAEKQGGSGAGKATEDLNADQLEKDILQAIGKDSKPIEALTNTPGAILATAFAKNEYARLRAQYLQGGMNAVDAGKQAYQDVADMIDRGQKDGSPGHGKFKFHDQEGFTYFANGGTQTQQDERRNQARKALANRAAIDAIYRANGARPKEVVLDTRQLLSTDQLQQAVEASGDWSYQPPETAKWISRNYYNGRISPWEIVQRQTKAFLGKDIVIPSSLRRSQEMSPDVQELLNRNPSYNRVSRGYRRMNAQGFDPSLVPGHYGNTVVSAAQENNIDPAVLAGLLEQESRWNPNAVSKSNARGLGQFMPKTAAEFGVDVTDPVSSINGAARYLRYLLDYFNQDLSLALYAYNGGMGNIKEFGGPIPGNKENEEYYDLVMERATRFGYRGYVPGLNPAIPQ